MLLIFKRREENMSTHNARAKPFSYSLHLLEIILFAVAVVVFVRSLMSTGGRRGGLVVSMLDSGSRGPGSSPGRVIVLCSWARHFTLTVPLSTQEYKWVPANYQGNLTKCWGVTCDGLASHPGGLAIILVASCYGNGENLRQ